LDYYLDVMPYDSAATRARLLNAAYAEFSERGLAGARVDRIAAVASANKQAIYAYFGSKDGLFDAMLADRLGVLADTVPFTPDDLPGYAGALFDALNTSPELVRLTQWRALERARTSPAEAASHLAKARKLRLALGLGSDAAAVDLLEIVIAMCGAWAATADSLRTIGGASLESRREQHRAMLVASVSAIVKALQ
jgi:AcrR family transcriptional regulator